MLKKLKFRLALILTVVIVSATVNPDIKGSKNFTTRLGPGFFYLLSVIDEVISQYIYINERTKFITRRLIVF